MKHLTSLARTTIIVSWLAVGLAFLSTTVHLVWLLRIRKRSPDVSDICVWLALVSGTTLVAQTTWAIVDEGSGKHQWDISQKNVFAVAKSLIVNEALWSICGTLIRVSSCRILGKIFGVLTKLRFFIPAFLCLCMAHGISSVLEICLICRPLASQWDANVKGFCGNQTASFTALEVSSLVLDLVILLVPIPSIINLQVTKAKRLRLILVLDAGALLLVMTALRLKALHLAASTDYTYSKSYLGLLSSTGCMLGVVVCNMIALPGVLKSAGEYLRKTATLQNRSWRMRDQDATMFTARQALHMSEIETSTHRSSPSGIYERSSSPVIPQSLNHSTSEIDREHADDDDIRMYERATLPYGPLESNIENV